MGVATEVAPTGVTGVVTDAVTTPVMTEEEKRKAKEDKKAYNKAKRKSQKYAGEPIAPTIAHEELNMLVARSFGKVKVGDTEVAKTRLVPKNFVEYKTYYEYRARIDEHRAAAWRSRASFGSKFATRVDQKRADKAKRAFEQLTALAAELKDAKPDLDLLADLGIDAAALQALFAAKS